MPLRIAEAPKLVIFSPLHVKNSYSQFLHLCFYSPVGHFKPVEWKLAITQIMKRFLSHSTDVRFVVHQVVLILILIAALNTSAAMAMLSNYSTGIRIPAHTLRSQTLGDSLYKLDASKRTTISLSGTTPIKNWKMGAQGLSGQATMTFDNETHLTAVTSLRFLLPVRNLKGDAQLMDNSAYASLKADKYPLIVFELTKATIQPTATSLSTIQALGTLTVAGVTRVVTLHMSGCAQADGRVSFSGSQPLRMSDYNVARPSLFFGTIKAADEMTLTYNLIFTK